MQLITEQTWLNLMCRCHDSFQKVKNSKFETFQLSRDQQPCVYHEFHLCVLTKAKQGHDVMVDVPVKVVLQILCLKGFASFEILCLFRI